MEGPNTIGTRERAWQKRQKTHRDMQRRTRRSASTVGGAAPDTIIGRAAADRAGARPTVPHVAKTRRNVPRRIAPAAHFERNDFTYSRRYTKASSPRCFLCACVAAPSKTTLSN